MFLVPVEVKRPSKSAIFFLKTHKTASSTVENMMMRIALKYNKTIARPTEAAQDPVNFNIYEPFVRAKIRKLPNRAELPKIVTQHTTYSPNIKTMYPKNSTYKFSILRGVG